MNPNDVPDYAAVLADLRARRAQLDAAIQALEAVLAVPAGAARSPVPKAPCAPTKVAITSYVGLSVLDAAKSHLQRTGHSLRTTELLGALQQGGVALTGKSPINSLGAILNSNLKKGAGIVRERRGVWALAEWHALRAEPLNGSRAAGLERLMGALQPVVDRPGRPPTSPSILMPSPAGPAALHA